MRYLALLALAPLGCGDGAGTAATPLAYAPHTELAIPADGELADPHVIKVGATWHLYATSTKDRLEVWQSEDLRVWRPGGTVWEPTPGTWNAEGEVWAPHVEVAEDGYYLYYSAAMRVGVALSGSPLGPFVELYDHPLVGGGYGGVGDGVLAHGWPLDLDDYAIDAFVLRRADGSLFLYFAAYSPLSCICASRLLDYATLADEPPVRVLCPDPAGWEGLIVEGPWIVEHEGAIHLTFSGNQADTSSYGLGGARSEGPLGPFERYPDNPLLRTDAEAGIFGPGHHSLVEGAHGDLLLFYHTQRTAKQGWDRRIRYAPVSFGDDGLLSLHAL